ncbi:hypothetical protein BPO_p0043 (plasmid) [Bergeyella porcorum]|uniref:Uncharacterized protein n=1 Tax=Bergeyella porcorum TaxID=1735111 RepID=A0AAU0F596_9FLAO
MLKSERKKIVFKEFDLYFNPLGYRGIKTGGDPTYVLKTKDFVVTFFMNFLDVGGIDISGIRMSILEIENHIINLLGKEYICDNYFYDEKRYFLDTIRDKKRLDKFSNVELKTEGEVLEFVRWYINYFEKEGKHFIETYSYLPNILKKMDELQVEGKYWGDILTGGVPHLFKGVIISKLCNDPNFYNKIIFVDNIFATEDISEYLPYYEKLKKRLKSVEPIYNV